MNNSTQLGQALSFHINLHYEGKLLQTDEHVTTVIVRASINKRTGTAFAAIIVELYSILHV